MKHTIMIVSLLCIAHTATAQAERNKDYNMDIPVLALNPERQVSPEYVYYSAFSPKRDGISGYISVVKDSLNNQQRWYVTNKTLMGLYQTAAHGNGMVPAERLVLAVKDSSVFFPPQQLDTSWERNHRFCYESVLPLNTSLKKRCEKMRLDIDNQFNYHSGFETRKVKVWVLKCMEQAHKGDTVKYTKRKNYFMTIETILAEVAVTNKILVDNDTGLPPGALFLIKKSDTFKTLPILNKEIERLGIYFEEEEREMNMLVISDKK